MQELINRRLRQHGKPLGKHFHGKRDVFAKGFAVVVADLRVVAGDRKRTAGDFRKIAELVLHALTEIFRVNPRLSAFKIPVTVFHAEAAERLSTSSRENTTSATRMNRKLPDS